MDGLNTSAPPQAGTGTVLPLPTAAEESAIVCTHWQIAPFGNVTCFYVSLF